MAEINFAIAFAAGVQSVAGTADATIAGLTGSLTEADGIVLGDPDSGIAESGIDFGTLRNLKEKAVVSGSFTRQASTFLSEDIDTFSIAIPLMGRGTASPGVTDSNYTPAKGIDALLQAAGLAGAAWGSGNGWRYVPAAAQIITVKLWLNGMAWVIRDCVASVEIDFTPAEVAIATFTLSGTVSSFSNSATFPTLNYGNQASISAPVVQGVGHNWGISAAQRGFTEATLSIDNQIDELPDSNSTTGKRNRQTGREITMAVTLFADSGSIDYERAALVRTSAPTDQQQFQVGTPGGSVANAVRVTLPTPEMRKFTPDPVGASYVVQAELAAVNGSANGELEIIFN